MPVEQKSRKDVVRTEAVLFLLLLLTGLLLLPIVIYVVGTAVFGAYEGSGFMEFYGTLHSEFRAGQKVVWFLMLSPYLVWQAARLAFWGFRQFASENRHASQP